MNNKYDKLVKQVRDDKGEYDNTVSKMEDDI